MLGWLLSGIKVLMLFSFLLLTRPWLAHGLQMAFNVGKTKPQDLAGAAGAHQLLLLVMRQSLWTLAVGLTVGVGGAVGVTRLIGSLLFGIGPADPLTLSFMATVLTMVALIASYIPARRAA
jgi:putative ABC transport system permease protein